MVARLLYSEASGLYNALWRQQVTLPVYKKTLNNIVNKIEGFQKFINKDDMDSLMDSLGYMNFIWLAMTGLGIKTAAEASQYVKKQAIYN